MPDTGNYSKFTPEELETMGMIVSKISARLSQIMTKYTPKKFYVIALQKSSSRRATLMIRLLTQFTGGSNHATYSNQNLKEVLREIAQSDMFDESDIASSWENKPKRLSTKEETSILHSLMERGIVENIVGKKEISETLGMKIKGTAGYPSTYRLANESARITQLLSKKEAVDFIISSLSKSRLLFILYWYLLASLIYFLRDCGDKEISQLVALGKKLIPNYQPPEFFGDRRLKPALASIDDQQLLESTKQLASKVMEADGGNTLKQFLLISGLLKLNRSID